MSQTAVQGPGWWWSCAPFPQTYIPNIATFPQFSCMEGKTSKPHLESAGCAQDLHVRILQLRAEGSAWSPSDFWLTHTRARAAGIVPVRGWLPARAWQVVWVVTWHTRAVAPSSPALPSWALEHPVPAGTITLPTPEMKMDWSKWSIRSSGPKIKLEIWAQAILAKSSSVQAGHYPVGTLEHLWAYRNPRNKPFMTFLLAQLPFRFYPGGSLPSINTSVICLIKMKSIFDTSPPDPTRYSRVKVVFPPLQREAMLFLALYFQLSWATLTCHFFLLHQYSMLSYPG